MNTSVKPRSDRSDKVVQLPTPYTIERQRAAEQRRAQIKHQRVLRRQQVGRRAVTLAAVGGLVAGTGALIKDSFTSPSSEKTHQEAVRLEKLEKTKEAVAVDNTLYVFTAGVRWHANPYMLNPDGSTPEVSNVDGEVKDGEVLAVKQAFTDTRDEVTQGWMAFRIVKDINERLVTPPGSPDALAHDLVWININELQGQSNENGGSFIDTYVSKSDPNAPKTLTVHVGQDGSLNLDLNHQPAALGQIMSTEQADKFLANYTHDLR